MPTRLTVEQPREHTCPNINTIIIFMQTLIWLVISKDLVYLFRKPEFRTDLMTNENIKYDVLNKEFVYCMYLFLSSLLKFLLIEISEKQ